MYIYIWKLNQTVLELDFWAVKFLFFPRRDLNSPLIHCSTISLALRFLSYYQKRAILPYVLFLVTVAMFVGRMELNEEVL